LRDFAGNVRASFKPALTEFGAEVGAANPVQGLEVAIFPHFIHALKWNWEGLS